MSNVKEVFTFSVAIANSKLRKCCRAKVYQIAEQSSARMTSSEAQGIFYRHESPNDLFINLHFFEEVLRDQFESKLFELPHAFRKRKATTASDISIGNPVKLSKVMNKSELERVFYRQYDKYNAEDHVPSAVCDTESSIVSSMVSETMTVLVTERVKCQLLDHENSKVMYKEKPERCHFYSQTAYPQHKDNENNVVYMSRHLHQHFDNINRTSGIPSFLMEYVSHNEQGFSRKFINKQGKEETVVLFETEVRIEFFCEADKNNLSEWFKDHTDADGGLWAITFQLYYEDPMQFAKFLKHKTNITRKIWQSARGVDDCREDVEDDVEFYQNQKIGIA